MHSALQTLRHCAAHACTTAARHLICCKLRAASKHVICMLTMHVAITACMPACIAWHRSLSVLKYSPILVQCLLFHLRMTLSGQNDTWLPHADQYVYTRTSTQDMHAYISKRCTCKSDWIRDLAATTLPQSCSDSNLQQ